VRNLIGCVRSLYINNINILHRLHRRSAVTAANTNTSGSGYYQLTDVDDLRVFYGDVGWPLSLRRPNFGCHNLALSTLRLSRPGALIQLPHQGVSESFNFRMSFATIKPDGVLVSTRIQDSLSPSTHGMVQVSHFWHCFSHTVDLGSQVFFANFIGNTADLLFLHHYTLCRN